jgi:hypothetical protein
MTGKSSIQTISIFIFNFLKVTYMKKRFLTLLFVAMLSSTVAAQHSDIEFGFDDFDSPTAVVLEQDERTSEGFQIFESAFEEDAFSAGLFNTDDPGFATVDETATGGPLLRFNPDDQVFLRVLDASAESNVGVGYVNFYNPETDTLEASGRVSVGGDATSATDDAIFNGAGIESGDISQLIEVGMSDSTGDPGGIHDHLVFDILDDDSAAFGAYGLLVQVDAVSITDTISSDPFWLIFNHQLDEDIFDTSALAAFGVTAVPEPASGTLVLGVAGAILSRRRRRLL